MVRSERRQIMEGFFVLAFLVLFGLFVVGLVKWNQHAREQQRRAFAGLGQRFGMTLLEPQHLRGPLGRSVLDVWLASETRGSGKHRTTVLVTRYRVTPPAPLRMGLKLSSQSVLFGGLADALGLVNDLRIGRDDVDAALRIGAADPDLAARLLRQDEVAMAAIVAARLSRFEAGDDHAFAQHDGWVVTPEQFHEFSGPLGALVDALVRAREGLRAGWEYELDASWGRLGEGEGFGYASAASVLSGTTPGGSAVELRIEVGGAALCTAARIRVARPLGLGLQMQRAGVMQSLGALFGAQDLQIGLPALDEPFTIKAARPADAQALLAGLGGELTTLAQTFGELRLDDAGLEAKQLGLLTDPAQVTQVLRALRRVAQALGGESTQQVGVFR